MKKTSVYAIILKFINVDERNNRQIKNIIKSFMYRGIMVITSFLTIPICLSFLSKSDYGAWLTVYSILSWVTFLDLGLGNGMKNKVSEAISKNDSLLARKIVSTNYLLMSFIIFLLVGIVIILSHFLFWPEIINSSIRTDEFHFTITICFVCFFVKLLLESINGILNAFQKPAYVVLISCVSNVLILSGTIIIKYLNLGSSNSVIYLAYCNSIIPLIVLILFSIYAFNTFLKKVRPNLYLYDKTIVKSIFALGSQFFIIQIAGLVLFSTDTLLVAKFFSSEQVTIFNIVLKLFSIFTIVWSIVIAPYWVAFNEAYVKEDFKWINKTIKLLINLWVLSLGLVIGLLFFIKDIYLLWLKEDVNIPMTLSVIVAAYVLISNYSNIFAYLINGIGKIRLQLYTSVISACLNIPLAIYLVKYKDMGVEGVVVATSVAVLIGAVLSTIQCYKIINRSASGIWNK